MKQVLTSIDIMWVQKATARSSFSTVDAFASQHDVPRSFCNRGHRCRKCPRLFDPGPLPAGQQMHEQVRGT